MASFYLRSLAVAAVGMTVAGCGVASSDGSESTDEAEVHVAAELVVADQVAANAAVVDADRVALPLAAAERYRGMAPGTIFVGARGAPGGKNPDGFLRKVTSVSVDGDHVVVVTSPATIADAIVDGSVTASSSGARLDDHLTTASSKGIEIDFANKPLFENVDVVDLDGKHAEFSESIRLDHAVLSAKPAVDVDVRIQNGKVTRFTSKVEGNLDSSIAAVASVSSSGTIDDGVLAALKAKKHDVDLVVYESKPLAIPTFSVGRVPVSSSVKFKVSLRCSLAFGGAVVANAGVEAKSFVRLGGMYGDGQWAPPIKSEFEIHPAFEVVRGAEIDARCSIVADAELLMYGASAITMSVAPYVDFSVARSTREFGPKPLTWTAKAGATGSMTAGDGIFGLPASELDRQLVEWKAPDSLEGVSSDAQLE